MYPYHPRRPLAPPRSPMGIVCIGGTEVSQAIRWIDIQPVNNVSSNETHDICMEDDLANCMRGAGYQEIDSVLRIIIEIWSEGTVGEAFEGRRGSYKRNHRPPLRWSSASNGYAFGRPPGSASSVGCRDLQTDPERS